MYFNSRQLTKDFLKENFPLLSSPLLYLLHLSPCNYFCFTSKSKLLLNTCNKLWRIKWKQHHLKTSGWLCFQKWDNVFCVWLLKRGNLLKEIMFIWEWKFSHSQFYYLIERPCRYSHEKIRWNNVFCVRRSYIQKAKASICFCFCFCFVVVLVIKSISLFICFFLRNVTKHKMNKAHGL